MTRGVTMIVATTYDGEREVAINVESIAWVLAIKGPDDSDKVTVGLREHAREFVLDLSMAEFTATMLSGNANVTGRPS